jgi:RHS repeat-associated protein
MPGRSFSSNSYRYGQNGQEKEDEIFNGVYSAEYWMYDSRLGRRWENDPIVKPHESPYAAFANNPIWFTDKAGLDTIPSSKVDMKTFNVEKDIIQLPEVTITPQETPAPSTASTPQTNTNNANTPTTINIPTPQQIELGGNNRLPVINDVLPNAAWRTQAPNWTACFTTCQTILRNNGVNNPAPRNLAIQMTTENTARNGLNIAPNANQGLIAINQSLQNGVPIIVGVNHTFGNNYNEGTTDHFIVIIGRGYDQGRLYYRFFDVGTQRANMGASPMNRLFLQNNNTLSGVTQYNQRRYTVSQVRPNGQ